jgi:drug/metabolite transporter (DMT)-like permease
LGVRTAGTVLGFQACLEVITGGGMAVYAFAARGWDVLEHARRHGAIGLIAGSLSVFGYLAFLAAAKTLPLGPIVAVRETSAIFGTVIGILVFGEAFGFRRIAASTFVVSGIVLLALLP